MTPIRRGTSACRTSIYTNVPTDSRIDLGQYHSPPPYTETWRCDLHPRSSPDDSKIVIDSAHGGNGRQMYLFEVEEIICA